MNIITTIHGQAEAERFLDRVIDENPDLVAGALYRRGNDVMADSVENYVPVRDGILRDSAFVDEPQVNGNDVSVALGYGGAAQAYAEPVHENPRAGKTGGVSPSGRPYKTWAQVGEWKYLETPLLNAVDGMVQDIADELRAAYEAMGRL